MMSRKRPDYDRKPRKAPHQNRKKTTGMAREEVTQVEENVWLTTEAASWQTDGHTERHAYTHKQTNTQTDRAM